MHFLNASVPGKAEEKSGTNEALFKIARTFFWKTSPDSRSFQDPTHLESEGISTPAMGELIDGCGSFSGVSLSRKTSTKTGDTGSVWVAEVCITLGA